MNRIYLDHAASTPVRKEALDAMKPLLEDTYGNPSSAHLEGRKAKRFIEAARREIADCVDADPRQVFFTSSATAANNIAIEYIGWTSNIILTSELEHPSVLNKIRSWWPEKLTDIDPFGRVDISDIKKCARVDEKFGNAISVCWVCSETGVINDIAEIAEFADRQFMYFHTDATQAIGHVPFGQMDYMPDFLTFGAHKFGGPRGVGVLVAYNDELVRLRDRMSKRRVLYGGEQEHGMWAGTENTAAIVGCAAALKSATENMEKRNRSTAILRHRLVEKADQIPGLVFNTPRNPDLCVPGIVNVSIPGMDGTEIVMAMDEAGIAVSSGSACSTGSGKPSAAILAQSHGNEARARGSVRFSFNDTNTLEEINYAMDQFAAIVEKGRNSH